MKTNQLMHVTIGNYTQPIEHLTMMGSLNHLWEYGNSLRAAKGLSGKDLQEFMRSSDTVEFIVALERKYGQKLKTGILPDLKIDQQGRTVGTITSDFVKTKRGKGGGTWAHLMILLRAAAYLDKDFEVEVYDTFINNKVLQWRDDGGDQFLALNVAIDAYLPNRQGKDNKGVFIQVAKRLKSKILPEGVDWNNAAFPQLEDRAKTEKSLVQFLQLGMVRDYDHLKELIDKL